MINNFDLTGKTALITGAAGNLGIYHAEALAELGSNIILTDIDESNLIKSKNYIADNFPSIKVIAEIMDVISLNSIEKVYESLQNRKVEVDILINNAAINPKSSELQSKMKFEEYREEEWLREIDVGLKGAFLCSQVFGRQMATRGSGNILNISSDLSVISPNQNLYFNPLLSPEEQIVKPFTYSIIKTGLIGLTKYLATYWAPNGVRVNAISPGGIEFEQTEEFVAKISTLIPMGRMAKNWEIKGAVQFLTTDASSYVTGHNLIVDGGRSIW